jgi:ubiquinone/menaquinone biosynthesis C-methylase UbiE
MMADEIVYKNEAAAGYDRAVARVSKAFVSPLLRAAELAPGDRVLDIATGTGLVAEAVLAEVGRTGHVTAADVSKPMVEEARKRLGRVPNASVAIEDGQSLSFRDNCFDAVLCGLGLMFFPDPSRGLSEFRRVLRNGGRVAVSVNTFPERSYNGRVSVIIARHVPALQEVITRLFSLGDETRLHSLFQSAGLREVEISTEVRRFAHTSFDDYFEPFERGGGSTGQIFIELPEVLRQTVREEVQRSLGDPEGPFEIEVQVRFARGLR